MFGPRLLAPWPVVEERARQVLEKGRTAESHIFNLGHGVLPDTDPDHARPADRPGARRPRRVRRGQAGLGRLRSGRRWRL